MFVCKDEIGFKFEGCDFVLSDYRFQTMTKAYPTHYHSENSYEIHYIENGYGKVVIDNEVTNVGPGFLFVTGPFINHGQIPDLSKPFEKHSVYFTIYKTKNTTPLLYSFFDQRFWIGPDNESCLEIFQSILTELKHKKIGYISNVIQLLKLLIIQIIRNYKLDLNIEQNQLEVGNDLFFEIEKIFLNEFTTITLSGLSKRLFVGERQLQRYIKKHYKKTFNKLKTEAKMFYAANELKNSNVSIAELANMSGYTSSEHFTAAFKKYYNTTPSKYRTAYRRQNIG